MEVIEIHPTKQRTSSLPRFRPNACPCTVKCTKRYVQPSRVQSYAPKRTYHPPTKPLEENTTYHSSYFGVDEKVARLSRVKSFRPTNTLDVATGKISDETTSKLSYKPIWGVVKAKPVVPSRRALGADGPMQCVTTARHDYSPKYVPRPEMIIPCGSIRTSSGVLDDKTTAGLSYAAPGPVEPVVSFKPYAKYRPPRCGLAKETTHTLSYQPFRVKRKEIYPWAQKPKYRPPVSRMDERTTYGYSYAECEMPTKEKPIVPSGTNIFPYGAQFAGRTVYGESYLPCENDPVVPVKPCENITIPNQKMYTDTTNKLSYQPVLAEKREPIVPCRRKTMGDGPMQFITTNRNDFMPKMVPRPDVIIPCDNIRPSDKPLDNKTTAALSYMAPGPIEPVQNFKPRAQYYRPTAKIEGETVNGLSYQPWTPLPKEDLPWARRHQYQAPKDPMVGDSVYNTSYPAPGYYIEECAPAECPCPPAIDEKTTPVN